ncbi:Crp/Fnr family transcriptional regulator [Aurantibacter crassamenti]|uniref:Crp/Fnr family transcriptional regulator n=1 Tax=Aurantibacter crassamenti TaxID=1837375 RepID=UPI001939AB40|nr:Crp/Fnr family transcriptional regulator [Aurantibacter crassamenti]MBM1107666.1 Crp/Fnr family transcriptional regulator [Aurantibacter crassamenti]
MDSLFQEIEKFITVSNVLKLDLHENFTIHHLKKNEKLVREGQYNVPLAFVKKGILRCFNLKNDKDVTNDFFFENTFVTDFEAFVHNKRAKQNFAAIETSEVHLISAEKLFKLTQKHPELREWGTKMTESLFTNLLSNNSMLKSDSPEERYTGMLQEKPMIIQRIPLHYVASYLGITQVHLSRIRKKIQ